MTARRILSEADKDPREALSPSIAKELVNKSPAHARHMIDHGKLATSQMDVGSVLHAMLLGVGKPIWTVQQSSWRTKKAQEERDQAHASGRVPMLERDVERLTEAAVVLGAKLADRGVDLGGDAEIKIEWDTGDGVLCRGVPDCVTGERIYDLKVGEFVAPVDAGRKIYTMGYDIQGAAYTEAICELDPDLDGRTSFALVFVEPSAPYAVTIVELDGVFEELGRARWQRAKRLWSVCQESGEWTDYSDHVVRAEPPRWALFAEGMA